MERESSAFSDNNKLNGLFENFWMSTWKMLRKTTAHCTSYCWMATAYRKVIYTMDSNSTPAQYTRKGSETQIADYHSLQMNAPEIGMTLHKW